MIAAAKRALPWLNGLLAYLLWRAGGLLWSRPPRLTGQAPWRACVIQVNALGDVLMVTPLLHALVEALGPGRVDVVMTGRTAPLLENLPGLGTRILLPSEFRWRHPSSVRDFLRVVRRLRSERYDAILDTSRLMHTAWLAFLAGPQRKIGPRLPRQLGPVALEGVGYLYTDEVAIDPAGHMIRQHLALLAPLGIPPASERMRYAPTPPDRQAAHAWLAARGLAGDDPYIVIHPGAKWPPKRWHADRFQALAGRLRGEAVAVVLVGDASDRPLLDAVAAGITPPPLIVSGDLPLGAVGALIQGARLFIGNDSGLMHIASAVGTPVLALFGPTFPERTGPLGPRDRGIVKPITCRPCRLYFTRDRCERGHNYCMDLIEVDEVWAAARSMLGPAAARPEGPGR